MKIIQVQICKRENCRDLQMPAYMSEHASGMDLLAAIQEQEIIEPGECKRIPTGIFIALPEGVEAQIRPRSGLALKHGITLLNSPATIDSDYRGEIGVLMINHGPEPFTVRRGDRIAQMVIVPVFRAEWVQVQVLPETGRASGGFGHTGIREGDFKGID